MCPKSGPMQPTRKKAIGKDDVFRISGGIGYEIPLCIVGILLDGWQNKSLLGRYLLSYKFLFTEIATANGP